MACKTSVLGGLSFMAIMLMFLSIPLTASAVPITAGNVVYTGSEKVFGTGFGTLNNLLELQNNPPAISETGSVFPTAPYRSGDATNQSHTYTFQELINLGITNASDLQIGYNVNETGANPLENLLEFYLQVYDTNGALVASTAGLNLAANGNSNAFTASTQQGQGKSAYVFGLDSAAIALFDGYFSNPDDYILGALGSIANTDDGADGFYLITGAAPVPEPGTVLCLGAGLMLLAVFRKRSVVNRLDS